MRVARHTCTRALALALALAALTTLTTLTTLTDAAANAHVDTIYNSDFVTMSPGNYPAVYTGYNAVNTCAAYTVVFNECRICICDETYKRYNCVLVNNEPCYPYHVSFVEGRRGFPRMLLSVFGIMFAEFDKKLIEDLNGVV